MNRKVALVAALAIAALVGSTARTSAHDPTTKVTYTREIVRLLDQHCVGCHRSGGAAPMPFTSYSEAKPWAYAMKETVLDREMPPWPAAPGYGEFANDPTLTPFEAGLLAAWADGGSPKGEDGDLPKVSIGFPPVPTDTLRFSAPDSTVELPDTGDRWITRWEFQPDPRAAQADISIVAGGRAQRLGVWVPPESTQPMPPGSAQLLPSGATIRVAADLRDGDASQRGGGTLRLWLADTPPPHRVEHQEMGCGRTTIDRDVSVFAIRPHVESGAISVSAQTAGGALQPLVVISAFDANYQPMYRFRRPIALPRGSVVDVRGAPSGCEIDLALLSAARQP